LQYEKQICLQWLCSTNLFFIFRFVHFKTMSAAAVRCSSTIRFMRLRSFVLLANSENKSAVPLSANSVDVTLEMMADKRGNDDVADCLFDKADELACRVGKKRRKEERKEGTKKGTKEGRKRRVRL
jgi:hypothetical protein